MNFQNSFQHERHIKDSIAYISTLALLMLPEKKPKQNTMLTREIAAKFKMSPPLTRGYADLHLSTFTA